MRRILDMMAVALVIAWVLVSLAHAAPPPLGGETQWGTLTVIGKSVTVTGGQAWVATGSIQENGEIHLHWLQLADERAAFGVYRHADGVLAGHWCWAESVRIEDGKVVGPELPETITIRTAGSPKAEGPDL